MRLTKPGTGIKVVIVYVSGLVVVMGIMWIVVLETRG